MMRRQRKSEEGFWPIATEMKEKITKEIELPENAAVSVDEKFLTIKCLKEVKREFNQRSVSIRIEGRKIVLESRSGTKEDKKIMGSIVAHIKNMINGSQRDHTYTLKICSGHFPMNVSVA